MVKNVSANIRKYNRDKQSDKQSENLLHEMNVGFDNVFVEKELSQKRLRRKKLSPGESAFTEKGNTYCPFKRMKYQSIML